MVSSNQMHVDGKFQEVAVQKVYQGRTVHCVTLGHLLTIS